MMEPQGRGAWHAHLLYIWQDQKAPYIPNDTFRELWGHGFVKIKKLADVDNVGAYLTAYLGDMSLDEYAKADPRVYGRSYKPKKREVIDENGNKVSKYFVKGARLNLYPANFNMIRTSKGIKRPIETMMTQAEAQKKVSAATKTFQSAIKLTDVENEFETIIVKEQYNAIRKKRQ